MPEVHWKRGGSNSDRIMVCPGSVNMADQYPEEPSSPAAIDGTHTHALLEYCLNNRVWDATEMVGDSLMDHEGYFDVDVERARRVNVALNYVARRMKEPGFKQLLVEEFVDAGEPYNVPEWGGSVDIAIIFEDEVDAIDYKDGGKPVDVETWQLVTYGRGIFNLIRDTIDRGAIKKMKSTIIQPKVYPEPRSKTQSLSGFLERAGNLACAMKQSMDPNAPRKASDKCKWCRGAKAGRCPEFNAGASVAIDSIFANVPVPTTVPAAAPEPPPMEGELVGAQLDKLPVQFGEIGPDTPVEQLAALIDAKPLITEIIKEAEAEALRRRKNGVKIPGQKLVRGRSQRKYVKDAADKLKKMRLKRTVFMEEKLKTPKKLVESDAFKALSEARQKRILELIEKPEGAIVLAPESDPRKAVGVDIEEVFAGVEIPAEPKQISFM